jgi:hypothetical protein
MTRTWLAATTALALMTGIAVAQTTETTTTTESTSAVPVVPVVPPTVVQSTTQRSVDPNGVVTDHTKTVTQGTTMSPYGDTTTTRRTTDTTTVR